MENRAPQKQGFPEWRTGLLKRKKVSKIYATGRAGGSAPYTGQSWQLPSPLFPEGDEQTDCALAITEGLREVELVVKAGLFGKPKHGFASAIYPPGRRW